jgi:hypothetical protein
MNVISSNTESNNRGLHGFIYDFTEERPLGRSSVLKGYP